MRKLLTFVFAVILTVALSVTVFAAPSPEAGVETGGINTGAPATATVEGTDQKVTVEYDFVDGDNADVSAIEAVEQIKQDAAAGNLTQYGVDEKLEVLELFNVTVEGYEKGTPITIKFKVDGVKENSKIAVLHWNGSEWENLTANATWGDGYVTVTFTSLSPVAILADSATAARADAAPAQNGGNNDESGDKDVTKAPQTGELPVVSTLVVMIALTGVFAVAAKRRNA